MDENNIIILPILKRTEDGKIDPQAIKKDKIEEISYHYVRQIMRNIEHQGFVIDKAVFRDFDLVFQAVSSALLRASSQHHPLQLYADENHLKKNSNSENQKEIE